MARLFTQTKGTSFTIDFTQLPRALPDVENMTLDTDF